MKFLADENVEGLVIQALRAAGHDVAEIAADAFGTGDSDVLARSVKECRILVTNDKDFAELAFLQRSAASGIVLIRLPHSSSRDKAAQIEAVVADLGGRLTGRHDCGRGGRDETASAPTTLSGNNAAPRVIVRSGFHASALVFTA